MSKILLLVAAVAVALLMAVSASAVLAAPASAATGYHKVGAFNESTSDGTLASHQRRIAVNHATGDVYVTNRVDHRVDIYHPNSTGATLLTSFGAPDLSSPYGIAIDQATGDVYVSDAGDVIKYTSDGQPTPTFTKDNTFTSPSVTGPLAFDDADDVLLVGDTAANTIRRYSTNGAPGATFDGSAGTGSPGAFTGLQDLAVDATGDVIVVDATGDPGQQNGSVSHVERYASNGAWESTLGPVEQAATVAVRPGSDDVLVSGNQNSVYVNGPPTVTVFSSTGAELGRLPVTGDYAIVAGMAADAGADGHMYVATDNGDFAGSYIYGPIGVQAFATFLISVPDVTDDAVVPMQFGATVSGTVDPHEDSTTWTFEYGKTTNYGSQTPAAPESAGSGSTPTPVTTKLMGLDPSTTYHYRLTATNAAGSSHTADRTFVTGDAVTVTDGTDGTDRAFEQVTPVDKSGQALINYSVAWAGSDGDSIAYPVSGGFPGSGTSLLFGYYVARRGPSGWTSTQADPPQYNPAGFDLLPTQWLASDLTAAVSYSARAVAPGAIDEGGNLYHTNLLSGERTTIAATFDDRTVFLNDFAAGSGSDGHSSEEGASDDLSHFAFTSVAHLLPGVTQQVAYEWADGRLRIASRLPDGSLPAFQSAVGGLEDGGLDISSTPRSVSADGRRVFFSTAADTTASTRYIYVRVDGSTTLPISVSHRAGSVGELRSGTFLGASADGTVVYFKSDDFLTNVDAGGMYRLDTRSDQLTLITDTRDIGFAYVGRVHQISEDGSTVTFASQNALTPDAHTYDYSEYAYRNGHITLLGGSPDVGFGLTPLMSPSGRYVVYASATPLTGFDGGCPTSGDPSRRCIEVYRTDLDTSKTICVSCVPGRNGDSDLGDLAPTLGMHNALRVQDDGRVVFDSVAPLSRADVNGKRDVYEYTGQALRLVSSGTGANAFVREMSADGRDVYFMTTTSLVPVDTDTSTDLYDARIGGGLASQQRPATVAPCLADGCQGAPSAPPTASTIGSVTFTGPSDPATAPIPAAAGKVKVPRPKTVRGTSGLLRVSIPTAGRIAAAGSGLASVKRTLAKAGAISLKLALTSKARAALRRTRSFKTTASVTFTPTGGAAQTVTVPVKFEVKR